MLGVFYYLFNQENNHIGSILVEDILKLILSLFKELTMKHSIWAISFAISIPILCWVSADLLRAVIELIKLLLG